MKKVFKIEDLCCANCAAKIETAIGKLDGVERASINFMAEKLIIEAEESMLDSIIKEAVKIAKRIEPDFRIIL